MKFQQTALLFAGALVSAGPLPGNSNSMQPREVPQEHSHDFVLDLVRTSLAVNNPKKIQDPVFGLLGNAAAKAGAGAVTNTDCLQQETADQAFTNAKAAGDIPGMAGALLYRSIERNTGSVGLASVICTETAVNAEIAALTQHQDPASANAASVNKGIALELAKQLALVGADPLLALEAGTFAPGNLGDNTGKGNTCDTVDDLPGCIFTQNLLVLDATPDEISSAATGTGADSSNVQAFTGTLGGPAPPITSTAGSARPFTVNGNTFVNIGAAIQRSCDIQHNACANAANSGKLSGGIAQCETQQAACSAANSNSKRQVALDFGACSNPTISFKSGLDGRTQNAFIADNQADFNHGSALNIAVIAGFICQRLDSSCKAGAAAQAACSSASAAAVATQQAQVAADVFNSIIGGGGAAQAVQTTAAAVVQATQTASAVVMTITQCA
ncbi:hypothetical protein B0T17DRAFT_565558 [Bombardia bombarda]|uniref:Cell wall mannoprotein n=1 Tax=Bombardia bombarda TaxID=252184 RepID=A0AA39TWX0_9PEZI|nr:hypothetical protein B0T17DRAFT_565558 [Bombardia bombarda]